MPHLVNLEIETDVLTAGGLAEIVNAILEFLLFQRNQISLVYSRFRNYVNSWLIEAQQNEAANTESLHDYLLSREREKAIKTKESMSAMRELITAAFDKQDVKSLRFTFGSTISTPKEVYTIHLPITSSFCLHLHDHHRLSQVQLNQLLISLVTHEDLDVIFSKILCPTNLFLEFETLHADSKNTLKTLTGVVPAVNKTQLPKSCKDVHFHLKQKMPATIENKVMNCCRELAVFDNPNAGSEDEASNIFAEATLATDCNLVSLWWESDIIVRGFKDKLVKGRSIWNK